jgi:hypothetical protein
MDLGARSVRDRAPQSLRNSATNIEPIEFFVLLKT